MPVATWNIWLINRGQQPLLYFTQLSERDAVKFSRFAAEKAFDGSDADGFLLIRSDYDVDLIREKCK